MSFLGVFDYGKSKSTRSLEEGWCGPRKRDFEDCMEYGRLVMITILPRVHGLEELNCIRYIELELLES